MNAPTVEEKELTRPSDFVRTAEEHGGKVWEDRYGRLVARKGGYTIVFTRNGLSHKYKATYRILLIRLFKTAGMLGILFFALIALHIL